MEKLSSPYSIVFKSVSGQTSINPSTRDTKASESAWAAAKTMSSESLTLKKKKERKEEGKKHSIFSFLPLFVSL
jgi:hypothetical protein